MPMFLVEWCGFLRRVTFTRRKTDERGQQKRDEKFHTTINDTRAAQGHGKKSQTSLALCSWLDNDGVLLNLEGGTGHFA
jgi:hypothetical protein